ncbi:hypothetical protein MLD38_009370 [Melastoma candidum]|uniref:Uncharacterized protein n=1 Tax=Melastoma candidum TaxID=119954 RepID=A0ACB9RXI4_9MYRT|nr:hypothetical protein MLD38_009370 [Melastoma candidum]
MPKKASRIPNSSHNSLKGFWLGCFSFLILVGVAPADPFPSGSNDVCWHRGGPMPRDLLPSLTSAGLVDVCLNLPDGRGIDGGDFERNEDGSIVESDRLVKRSPTGTIGQDEVVANASLPENGVEKDEPKSERVARDEPLKYDEFKHKAIGPLEKPLTRVSGNVMHRVEPSGAEYDYASASKGAKVLAFNKEAKGASNILGKDVDRYLRNPCSAESKFVLIELSEETLVYTIEIANFEHHSSNVKDFEVVGSLVYPTKTWVKLGNFTAKNVKQPQRFRLEEPKWVRYLKFDFLSHYGLEFYCTLSTVKVFGVDAVERMLEDMISLQGEQKSLEGSVDDGKPTLSQGGSSQSDGVHQDDLVNLESAVEDSKMKAGHSKSKSNDPVDDLKPQPVGRLAGDSVLKILTQKVRSLDMNLSILERYLEEMNVRYGNLLKELDGDVAREADFLEKIKSDLKVILDTQNTLGKEISELVSWKSLFTLQIDILRRDNNILRSDMDEILANQRHMENKSIVAVLFAMVCGFLSAFTLLVGKTVDMLSGKGNSKESYRSSRLSWVYLLLNCAIVGIILLL